MTIETFESLFNSTKPTSCGCIEWPMARTSVGYGCVTIEKRRIYAHRLIFEQKDGPIPEGLLIFHHCDNPPCFNPAHLFLGTKRDNGLDASRKGILPSGERSHFCKLSDIEVSEIRSLYKPRSAEVLAERFGVCSQQIYRIVHYKSRKTPK
jgi:hypothetical protein